MNKKKRMQLFILCGLFLIVAAAFAALKIYQANVPEEAEEESAIYQVLNVASSDVTEIGMITEEGTTNLKKEGDTWKCLEDETAELDESLIESFLEEICQLTSDTQIENAEDLSQYGLEDPLISVTIQWDSNMYTIKLGDYNSMITSYYISINDETTVYTADSSVYSALNKSLDNFLMEEAEETEETED